MKRLPDGGPIPVFLPCHACDPAGAMTILAGEGLIRCPRCGHEERLIRLPLLLITGVPGAGKSAVVRELTARFSDFPVFDTDLFGLYSHPNWTAWANTWLLVAHGIAQGGKPTGLCGTLHKSAVEGLEARALLGSIRACNLDLRDDEIRSRLRRRPSWYEFDDARIEREVRGAADLRSEADHNLDTTELSAAEVATRIATWMRAEVNGPTERRLTGG